MKLNYLILLLISILTPSAYAQVGINTLDPNPQQIDDVMLDINGRTIIRNLEKYNLTDTSVKPIGVNKDGVILRIDNLPTDVAFFQSSTTNKFTGDELTNFNNGGDHIVQWTPSTDQIFNDLLEFNESDYSFSFLDDGKYEINGFVNFGIIMPSNFVNTVSSYIVVNASVQYLKNNDSSGVWQDFATASSIFTGGILSRQYLSETINIPSVLYSFQKGDRIRVIVSKPEGIDVGGFEISKPTGSIYSKSIRVLVP